MPRHTHIVATLICATLASASVTALQVRPPGGSTASVPLTPALEWDKRTEVGERLSALGNDLAPSTTIHPVKSPACSMATG